MEINKKNKSAYLALIAGLFVILVVILSFSSGVGGAFYFDDFLIIDNLSKLHKGDITFSEYMLNGFTTGPLGRPLSMLTFLIHQPTTKYGAENIFWFNISLHALNTALAGVLSWQIGRLIQSPYAAWLGVLTAALWGLAPIQAATVLIAVQRMTEISTLFVFLGLTLWVIGLRHSLINHNQGKTLQITGLIGMTFLATLSKENGVLLPLFAGVIEFTLLSKIKTPSRNTRARFYLISLTLLIGYLFIYTIHYKGVYWERNFDIWQRLITESGILFEYLRQTIAPRFLEINPFHDAHPVSQSLLDPPWNIVTTIFWPFAILAAWLWRKRWPIIAFALLWFTTAHVLESTVIGLELYFEHRQYLAWFGPAFALAFFTLHASQRYQRAILFIFFIYLILLASILLQTSKIWGSPALASKIWFEKDPQSGRATSFLVRNHIINNDKSSALRILEYNIDKCPLCLSSIAQAAQIACLHGDQEATQKHITNFIDKANIAPQIFATDTTLFFIHEAILRNECKFISFDDLKTMNNAILNRKQPLFDTKKQSILMNLFRIAIIQNDIGSAKYLMPKMYEAKPTPKLAIQIVENYINLGLNDEAIHFIETNLCPPKNSSLLDKNIWNSVCLTAENMAKKQ